VIRNWFAKPRWKTYAAQSGYVYQYIFQGLKDEREYLFHAVSGEDIAMTCAVEFNADTWVQANRELSEIERYGIAKMALLRSLDTCGAGIHACAGSSDPALKIRPSEAEVADICRELDL
jgi:hypothetical protein